MHRRGGKTALAVNKLIIEACKPENKGRTFWYIAPTYSQGKEIVWADPKMLFKFLPPELIVKKNESELWIKTFNNTRIVIKGGDEPDSLLGADPYGIVVDETQNQKPELYDRVLKPILAANGGWIWLLGTPRLKDHFHKLAVYAKQSPKWQFYHLSALTSNIIPQEELDEIRLNTPEDLFRQEYLAEFLDGEGVVFRNIKEACVGSMKDPIKGHTYSIGVDLARKLDFTVITVYDQSKGEVVHIERFRQVDWSVQEAKIEAMARRYSSNGMPSRIKIDSTGVGDPIYQALRGKGLPVMPVIFTRNSKKAMVTNLQIMMDHQTLILPDFPPLINELEVFKEKNGKFSAPDDFHDDCVCSLILAVYQAPFVGAREKETRRSLLMKKYRKGNRYSKKRKELYNLSDLE